MARDITRRHFVEATLKSAAVSAVALYMGPHLLQTRAVIAAEPALKFFNPEQAAAIRSACARIIPSSEVEPGATEVGAMNVIDFVCSQSPLLRPLYTGGAAGLDETARLSYGKPFAKLEAAQQDEVLAAAQRGKARGTVWKQLPSPMFFLILTLHTKSAYYTNPASFKFTGYPGLYDYHKKKHG